MSEGDFASGAPEVDTATAMWADGDRGRALSLCFRDNRLAMYAIARKIAGSEYAADIAQDVLLKVWNNQERFDPARGTLGSYLRVTTRGASIDFVRSTVARRSREDRSTSIEASASVDGLTQLLDRERALRVADALNSINENERDAVISAFYGNTTYREIAARTGIPEGTIKSRIRLGLIHLRAELRDLL